MPLLRSSMLCKQDGSTEMSSLWDSYKCRRHGISVGYTTFSETEPRRGDMSFAIVPLGDTLAHIAKSDNVVTILSGRILCDIFYTIGNLDLSNAILTPTGTARL